MKTLPDRPAVDRPMPSDHHRFLIQNGVGFTDVYMQDALRSEHERSELFIFASRNAFLIP
jgi:hypothetical protein